MLLQFKKAVYKSSCTDPDELFGVKGARGEKLPEIAIVGRSNVGKSSLINYLTGIKELARTSATPGKTQMVNYFLIDEKITLVDLPGYGFAAAPLDLKKAWAELIDSYLEKSSQLSLILFLLDSRRIPSKEDKQFFTWARYHKKPLLIVFTKMDKVTAKEQKELIAKALEEINAFDCPYVHTSSSKRLGRMELIEKINSFFKE